ncbi:MAG: PilZ domain-containing protein [Magnetococcales bacterium]|nr:PilZ domain-containing protein [Magnetococcales bacterium]
MKSPATPKPSLAGTLDALDFDTRLRLGVEDIDGQHFRLFQAAFGFKRCIDEVPFSPSEVDAGMLELVAYTSDHLDYEEYVMRLNRNPYLSAHILAHHRFKKEISDIAQKNLKLEGKGKTNVAREAFELLVDWLVNHIERVDKTARAYMVRAGRDASRGAPRLSLNCRVAIEFADHVASTGTVTDVSVSGAFVSIPTPLPAWFRAGAGGLVHLLPLSGSPPLPCRVTRLDPERGVALEFQERQTIHFVSALCRAAD